MQAHVLTSGTRVGRFNWKSLLRFACCIAASGAFESVWALSLEEAIRRAQGSDPIFISAQANLKAARARSDQAVAGLLPQLSATANTTSNHRQYSTNNVPLPPEIDHYNSNASQISLTQPLWHRSNQIATTQADAVVAQAEYQLTAAEQDLLVRLAQAWFDVLLARDVATFVEQQVIATQHEWMQVKRAASIELVAQPALEEARTKYDDALAEQAAAETDKNIKVSALEQIIGPLPSFVVPTLSDEYRPAELPKDSLDHWLEYVGTDNPNILAALRALQAAQDEARKQRAGHQPTLDVVASYGRNAQAVGGFPGQEGYNIRLGSVGLQLSIPLYAGGGQNAKVREALAMQEKAMQDVESAKRTARSTAKQAWFVWSASNVRQTAGLQAVRFASMALKAAERGKAQEVKAELDVLQARQKLYSSLRDLKKARYDMITSYFKLKAAVGQLIEVDLIMLDAWLKAAQ